MDMRTYFCHGCSVRRGYLRPPPMGKAVGSSYQLAKYVKHTVPDQGFAVQSVFETPSTQVYAGYLVDALAAGSIEIDERGSTNVIWAAGRPTGFLFRNGSLIQPQDAVKVVLSSNTSRVHAYPANSTNFASVTCSQCGGPAICRDGGLTRVAPNGRPCDRERPLVNAGRWAAQFG
jgi:hypothetical protein